MISSPIEEIKNRLDIVDVVKGYIKIEKAGVNYRAVCPFHSEKKPSFFISPARQIWHCFGACGIGGNIFNFVMKIEGVEFGDALRILAQKAGVELKREDPKLRSQRQRLYEINDLACSFFEKQLANSLKGQETEKYLQNRGINEESIKKWRLGYAPDTWQGLSDFLVSRGYNREEMEKAGLALKSFKTNSYYDRFRGRIIFPIFDLSSQVIGFGARVFKQTTRPDNQEEAKYINTPATFLYDKSRVLYGLNKSGIEIRKENKCILVEGYTDAILAHQAGFENVVATSGTALTNHQLRILKRYSDNLLTAFDMDIAGDSATKRGIDLAQVLGFNIKIVAMPKGSDPADIVSSNSQEWEDLVKGAKTIHDFYFENTLSMFDKNTLEGKKEISKILLPVISKISNAIEKGFWVQSLSGALEIKEEDILDELAKIKVDSNEAERFVEEKTKPANKSRKDLLEDHLIVLSIKSPQDLELIESQFLSQRTCQIIDYFKEKGISAEVPSEFSDFLNPFFLRAEIYEIDDEIDNEFRNCLKEIKTLAIKDKLDGIGREIKRAEQEKDFKKVQELTQEFNHFSKSRCDLEIS